MKAKNSEKRCSEHLDRATNQVSNRPDLPPFRGRSGRMLASLVGMDMEEFLSRFQTVNLLSEWPGRKPGASKGHLFPQDRARVSAARIDLKGRIAIICGRRVAEAFGVGSKVEFLKWFELRGGRVTVIPHPSGIVRFYNLKENRKKVGRLLKRILKS